MWHIRCKKHYQLPCSHGWFQLHMATITKAIDDYGVGDYNRETVGATRYQRLYIHTHTHTHTHGTQNLNFIVY